MSSSLEPDIERFVRDYIDSVEQLEILVLLRLHRDRAFTASELAQEMRTSEGSASTRLRSLVGSGLVRQLPAASGATAYQYSPADAALDARVASVATAYVTRRYAVIDVIFGKPTDKIRLFGEAFRLRKDKDDEDG